MIIYATKLTFERYKLKYPKDLTPSLKDKTNALIMKEQGDRLLEWGAKIFYFDRRKCLQIVNFKTKFTLFLVDVKSKDVDNIGNLLATYLFELYKEDQHMIKAINELLLESPHFCFERLVDKTAIATLNYNQLSLIEYNCIITDYFEDGVLMTIPLNHFLNFKWLVTITENKKARYIYPGLEFREQLLKRFDMWSE